MRDFYRRVAPPAEELEALIRVGAFDGFGKTRIEQFWEGQYLRRAFAGDSSGQGWLLPAAEPKAPPVVREPTRLERLQSEAELLDFPASGHPLELHDQIAWGNLLSGRQTCRAHRPGSGGLRTGHRATDSSPGDGRADEISHPG